MKKFEILRYLKRFSLLIFLVALAGAAAIYLYADGKQQYTASVIIRYTNSSISDGLTPDGSALDVNEIYSSTVISQAMDALGASGRLSTIRILPWYRSDHLLRYYPEENKNVCR